MFTQAVSRGIRSGIQAMIRIGGEQGPEASLNALKRVSRLAAFLAHGCAVQGGNDVLCNARPVLLCSSQPGR